MSPTTRSLRRERNLVKSFRQWGVDSFVFTGWPEGATMRRTVMFQTWLLPGTFRAQRRFEGITAPLCWRRVRTNMRRWGRSR